MEVNGAVLDVALLFKFIDRTFNVSASERLCIGEQDVVFFSELGTQGELKGDAKTFTTATTTALVGDSLPLLAMHHDCTFLDSLELLVGDYKVYWAMPVAQKSGLIAIVHDAEAQSTSRFNRTLRWHTSHSEVELRFLFHTLDIGHRVWTDPQVVTVQLVFSGREKCRHICQRVLVL